jgi:hypothetical protein
MIAIRDLRVAVGFVWILVEIFVGRIFRLFRLRSAARVRGVLVLTWIVYVFDALAGWTRRRNLARLGGSSGTCAHEALRKLTFAVCKGPKQTKIYFSSSVQFDPSPKRCI